MLPNTVKLVVWDLDDTFWRGTLAEGDVVAPIEANLEIVRRLSERGIVNSICSKNDFTRARAKLTELGTWEHFVFPRISFSPKGGAIAELIEAAGLRAQNVLFVDDNPANLEEASFYNPGIMTGLPQDVLDGLLDHPSCAGKPDPDMRRLKQYQNLQRKSEERSVTTLSNEEFLRASGIRVEIDYDVEANFERVIELINRTNQLNYTKQRLETPQAVESFRAQLNEVATYAGCVRASDRYGDYGLIGFFLGKRRPRGSALTHFLFSCRTMNMGIEQYVYETLGKPEIAIADPVSYGLSTHPKIDWINGDEGAQSIGSASNGRLVLLGGCDLLQLATYCSTDRAEFVNTVKEGVRIRYDDPSFILNDRELIRTCETLREIPWWTYEDAVRFDEALAEAELVLVSLWFGMVGTYCCLPNGMQIRLEESLRRSIESNLPGWSDRNLKPIFVTHNERLKMLADSLDAIGNRCPSDANIFVVGCDTRRVSSKTRINGGGRQQRRIGFNEACRAYCAAHSARFHYVDVDTVVPEEYLLDSVHFTRQGYHAIAEHVLKAAKNDRHPREVEGVLHAEVPSALPML